MTSQSSIFLMDCNVGDEVSWRQDSFSSFIIAAMEISDTIKVIFEGSHGKVYPLEEYTLNEEIFMVKPKYTRPPPTEVEIILARKKLETLLASKV